MAFHFSSESGFGEANRDARPVSAAVGGVDEDEANHGAPSVEDEEQLLPVVMTYFDRRERASQVYRGGRDTRDLPHGKGTLYRSC